MTCSLSIITATYNSARTVEDCMESVSRQNIDVEHIIVDGGSTDETLEIVKSFPHVNKIISERDNGMYDAMNKGIVHADGDVIGILNSDDFYENSSVLHKVLEQFSDDDLDSCYGDLQYVDAEDTSRICRHWKSGALKDKGFLWGWMPPHPTFFVRRSIYEKYGGFNMMLGSAADYEIMLRLLVKHKISTAYIPEVLVKMRTGGASNRSLWRRFIANRMDRKAWEINGLNPYPWTILMKPLRKVSQFISL